MTEFNDFDKYQHEARMTAIYPNLGKNLWYPALGLAGEAGEVANKVKKIYRDKSYRSVESISEELGDVLWYVAAIASELDASLSSIAEENLAKLQSRADRDKVHGEGDER